VPEGLEEGSPFGVSILAVALYLRFVHAISYKRLVGLFAHLFGLEISEGALDSLFRGARSRLDAEVAMILTRLRRARVIGSDQTGRRPDLLELGVPERRGGDPRDPAAPVAWSRRCWTATGP
jgi:transposase